MSDLPDRILSHMTAPPPQARLFRQRELDTLGPVPDVEQALQELARAQRIGSPGKGFWFPLEAHVTDLGNLHFEPPALLRDMAENLLRREGVHLIASPQEDDYHLNQVTQGREGVWGVPSFEDIGVARPVNLSLAWGRGRTQTVYQEERSMAAVNPAHTPTTILDPVEFQQVAARNQVTPARMEKDVWVNRALYALGRADMPDAGLWLFAGGTALSKAWRLSPRYSEDIDLRFQGNKAHDRVPDSIAHEVHAHLLRVVAQHLLVHLPSGRIDTGASSFDSSKPVQRVLVLYESHYSAQPGSLKLEIMFTPGLVPWQRRPVYGHPNPEMGHRPPILTHLPCVPPWVTMTGKLHALAQMQPGADVADMRHVVDLGSWLTWLAATSWAGLREESYGYMMRQAVTESLASPMLDWLAGNLHKLATDPLCGTVYEEFVARMFPGNRTEHVPHFQESVAAIQALWQDMCNANWEDPNAVIDIPDNASYLDKETDFIPPSLGGGDEQLQGPA